MVVRPTTTCTRRTPQRVIGVGMARLLLLAVALALAGSRATALDNGRALLPVAGWSAWNTYSFHPTQQLVEDSMRALAQPRDWLGRTAGVSIIGGPQKSLVDLGYVQANLDDAWQECRAGVNGSFHDSAGNPLINPKTFPNISAMNALGASLGIEPGWYMNNCLCSENQFTDPAQIAMIVRRSAEAVARLGFKSLKLDSCGQFNNITLWNMALNATGVAIAIENCHQGGMTPGQNRVPGQHCSGTTAISDCPYTSYRTSDDIQPTWAHVLNNVNSLVPFLGDELQGDAPPRSRPGGWAYGDALQTGMLGVLSWSGYTPNPGGWLPLPLVEDRSHFGMHCITSSPLILSFNVTNDTLVQLLWPIIANEEALAVNRQWAGTPGRLVATIRPPPSGGGAGADALAGGYVLRKGQLGQVSGWGFHPGGLHPDLGCPHDVDQLPGVTPVCNLLKVANVTITEAQGWCTANAACAAFSYRGDGVNWSAVAAAAAAAGPAAAAAAAAAATIVYFKDSASLSFMDSNFHAGIAGGQVQSGWLSQIKAAQAPPGSWRSNPCGGTVCPPNTPPCHMACFSIAPCCSATAPAGETLAFDGQGQLWAKRLLDGSLALLFVNLGEAALSHSFTLQEVGLKLNRTSTSVAVRDVWKRSATAPIPKGGEVMFDAVAGHDSRFVVLTPQSE